MQITYTLSTQIIEILNSFFYVSIISFTFTVFSYIEDVNEPCI